MFIAFLIFFALIVLIYWDMYRPSKNFNFTETEDVWVCLTTIPERLRDPWFYDNLQHLLKLKGTFRVLVTIPYKYSRTGEKYVIPPNVMKLSKDPKSRLTLHRTRHDLGPITKLIGALRFAEIKHDSCLLVCDDDVRYKNNFVIDIVASFRSDKACVHTYCDSTATGFAGFMGSKKTLMPLLTLYNPPSCFTIDDDFIALGLKHLNIETVTVNRSWFGLNGFCSMDRKKTDTHPKWNELNILDDRSQKQKQCKIDFKLYN